MCIPNLVPSLSPGGQTLSEGAWPAATAHDLGVDTARMSSGSTRTYEVHRTYCVLPLTVHRSSLSYWNTMPCRVPAVFLAVPSLPVFYRMAWLHTILRRASLGFCGGLFLMAHLLELLCPSVFLTAKDSPAPTQRLNLNFITTFPLIPSLQDRSKGSVNKNV